MILSLGVLIAAGLGAMACAAPVGEIFGIGPVAIRPVIGFVFSLIVLLIVGSWVKRLIRPKEGFLRQVDGLAGATLGLLRGALILSLLLGLLRLVDLPHAQTTSGSYLYPVLIRTASTFVGVLRPFLHLDTVTGALSRSIS